MFALRVNAPARRPPQHWCEPDGEIRDYLAHTLRDALRLPISSTSVEVQSPMFRLAPRAGDVTYTTSTWRACRRLYVEIHRRAHHPCSKVARSARSTTRRIFTYGWRIVLPRKLVFQVGEAYDLGDLFSSMGAMSFLSESPGSGKPRTPPSTFGPSDRKVISMADSGHRRTTRRLHPARRRNACRSRHLVLRLRRKPRRATGSRRAVYGGLQRVSRNIAQRLPMGALIWTPARTWCEGNAARLRSRWCSFGFSVPLLVILAYSLSSLSETESAAGAGSLDAGEPGQQRPGNCCSSQPSSRC